VLQSSLLLTFYHKTCRKHSNIRDSLPEVGFTQYTGRLTENDVSLSESQHVFWDVEAEPSPESHQ